MTERSPRTDLGILHNPVERTGKHSGPGETAPVRSTGHVELAFFLFLIGSVLLAVSLTWLGADWFYAGFVFGLIVGMVIGMEARR